MDQRFPFILLYDGHCGLCSASVNFIIDNDPSAHFRFAPLQSPVGQQLLRQYALDPSKIESVVLIENAAAYTRSDAVLRALRHLRGPWPALAVAIVLPATIRDAVYDWVVRHRYRWFGRYESCRLPTAESGRRFLQPDARSKSPGAV